MEVLYFFAVLITNNIANAAIVHSLGTVFGIPHNFVDEVAEMEHEAESIFLGSMFVFIDHSAISVLRPVIRRSDN